MIGSFGLKFDGIYGVVSDAGSDIKYMLREGLHLNWEWCIPHLSNAATKWACGIVNNKTQSRNPEMTDLIVRMSSTIQRVKVEKMGSLFSALCELQGEVKTDKLLDYKSHRFLGFTNVILRILQLWDPLVEWFAERIRKAARENKPPPTGFLLENDKTALEHILSLLVPITCLNKKTQGDNVNQVESLLLLYRLRTTTLNKRNPLKHYKSTKDNPIYIQPTQIGPLAGKTQLMLAHAFEKIFFSRYMDRAKIRAQSFNYEIQLFLTPNVKDLDRNLAIIATFCQAEKDIPSQASAKT